MLGLCPLSMYIVDMYRVDFSTFDVVLVGYIHIQIQIHITIIILVRYRPSARLMRSSTWHNFGLCPPPALRL